MPKKVTKTEKKASPFKRGYEAAKEAAAQAQSSGDSLYWLRIRGDKKEAVEQEVIFLHEEPVVARFHNLGRKTNGKVFPQQILCTQDKSCQACDMGSRTASKSVYLVLVPSTRDDGDYVVRRFAVTGKASPLLERLSTKKGIAQKYMTVVRTGNDTNTSYAFEIDEDVDEPFDLEKIADILPDALSERLLEIWEENDSPDVDDDNIGDVYMDFLEWVLQSEVDQFEENIDDYEVSSYEKRGQKEEEPTRREVKGRGKSSIITSDDDDDE